MSPRVGYAGVAGAFAEEACRAFLPGHEPVAHASFADVTAAVARGESACGMLPLENKIAGAVPGVAELIEQAGLIIAARHKLAIRLHLMALDGIRLDQLRIVKSHPMALAQCTATLARLGLVTEAATNTAVAAAELAEGQDRQAAVLASERASTLFGLPILLRDLQDQPDNETSFGVIGRPGAGAAGAPRPERQ